ncbi:MAG TPA: hypothetical protein VEV87_03875, partial [Chitinophagaceae bacterium]|nr:hypothetical protein [Chitinophagaceae bacterium]
WEGAYRLYLGQVPYRDFGMPVGYMYWVIPAFFFKIFGPQLITLVKAQVFINILGALAFRSILISVGLQSASRFAAILLFCLSYSFFNFWPWYNHTVIVYELIALAFLFRYLFDTRRRVLFLVLAGVFVFFSFFTKQDGGGLAFVLCVAILLYEAITKKKWGPIGIFIGSFLITGLPMILPFAKYNFGYWFNYGQWPHASRVSLSDIISEFLSASHWLKFYLLIIVLLLTAKVSGGWKPFIADRRQVIFSLLVLGILAEAAIFQVTSYVPVDNNIFFHSFAIAFILFLLLPYLPVNQESWKLVLVCSAGIVLWWSQVYWRYVERFFRQPKAYATTSYGGYQYAGEVNRNTYMIDLDTTDIPMNEWRTPNLNTFQKILLPNPTVDGIERLMNLDIVKGKKNLKVLNMTELTPLAAEIPFELEANTHYPLWYHKGVGMFDKETNMFCDRINKGYYDLVLYEYIPYLNNFYPYEVRSCLEKNYLKIDSFPAPRNPTPHAWVEVYRKVQR